MPTSRRTTVAAAAVALAVASAAGVALVARADNPPPAAAPKAALSVTVVQPQAAEIPIALPAVGSIAAWQEASVGVEAQGLRLAELKANVGDRVRRGQVLAVFADDLLRAELAQAEAGLAEARAAQAAAAADARRARELQASGALSAQQIAQYQTAESTAAARVQALEAQLRLQQLRLRQSRVLAPDDGIVSSRTATLGAVMPAGTELFRLIRQGRLEWVAELPATDLARVRAGQKARLASDDGAAVEGTVRLVAPTVDAATRNGKVYVSLPAGAAVKPGMFARGDIELGLSRGQMLPAPAVLLRDGFHQIFVVGADGRVDARKVEVGRRVGDRIEIRTPLEPQLRVVASGGAFLADGDTVKVVAPAAPGAPVAPVAANAAAVTATK